MATTSTSDLICPAETYGTTGGCRWCKYTGGGPSKMCVAKVDNYHKRKAKAKADSGKA